MMYLCVHFCKDFQRCCDVHTIIIYILHSAQERDKLILTRTVIYELVNVLRFKSQVPDENLLMMVQVRIDIAVQFSSLLSLD